MGRTVADVALLDSVITGIDAGVALEAPTLDLPLKYWEHHCQS